MLPRLRRESALQAIAEWDYFRTVEWHDAIDSTNRYAARVMRQEHPPELPALFVADAQTHGVGRGKNVWWSPTGCLMFSMVIGWDRNAMDYARLPLLVGMAVARSLAPVASIKPLVKWPNDVVIDDRKACGILIESSARTTQGGGIEDVSVIGIGINCQVDFRSAPEEIRSVAISVHEVAKSTANPEASTPEATLVRFLSEWMERASHHAEDPTWLDRSWSEWSWLDGKWVEVTSGERVLSGIVRGIDRSGALLLEDHLGRQHTILSGTVRTIPR